MMFLANENFPRPSILLLRANGYIIESIQEKHQGISDEKVLQIAQENKLIILTFDKDYGELIFRYASTISISEKDLEKKFGALLTPPSIR